MDAPSFEVLNRPLRAVKHTAFASAARTADPTSFELDVNGHRGVDVYIDVTAVTATPGLTVTISYYDELTSAWVSLLASASIATVTGTRLTVYPGLAASANAIANNHIRNKIRIAVAHADADSATYSVVLNLLP